MKINIYTYEYIYILYVKCIVYIMYCIYILYLYIYIQYIYIYNTDIYIYTPTIWGYTGPHAAKVGEVLAEHMQSVKTEDQRPTPDQGMRFQDMDDDSSDSGLESII